MNTELEHTVDYWGELWRLNGLLHRTDGPARIDADGEQRWYLHGELHREDGPALICANGEQRWWLNGQRYSSFADWLFALDADDKTKTLLMLKWSTR